MKSAITTIRATPAMTAGFLSRWSCKHEKGDTRPLCQAHGGAYDMQILENEVLGHGLAAQQPAAIGPKTPFPDSSSPRGYLNREVREAPAGFTKSISTATGLRPPAAHRRVHLHRRGNEGHVGAGSAIIDCEIVVPAADGTTDALG
jgi:hypothetical protein